MKTKIIIVLGLFIIGIIFQTPVHVFSQENYTTKIKFSERIPADLEIEVKVKETGAIGYAYCFKGEVLKVVRGTLPDTEILITVLAGDKENYDILSGADENTVYKLFLVYNKSNEEYHTAYITGFVDSERNSWRIIAIEKQ